MPSQVHARSAHAPYRPRPVAAHLPDRLTICLWDFSWYVRSGAGEPFEHLDAAAKATAERGYNTVRICAMPFLLFGSGLDTSEVSLDRLSGQYAQGVRWYNVASPARFDGRAKLIELFEACRRHGLFIILSSWEYQQSASFSTTSRWWDALAAVDPEDRPTRLADALADLVDFVTERGLEDRIAFTELHNEVTTGHLADGLEDLTDLEKVVAIEPRLSRGLARFHEREPEQPVTVNYFPVPVGAMRAVPREIDVFIAHPYVYAVLNEVNEAFDLHGSLADFPRAAVDAAGLLRPGAPAATDWVIPDEMAWKLNATVLGQPQIFFHDWVDAEAFDRFLYERYESHRIEMTRILSTWLEAAADFAIDRGIPFAFGEGWIGYTPLHGNFEEGPVGAEYCRFAVRESARVGAWGTIVCSNAAPHHPMWADVALQRSCNEFFLAEDKDARL
ncbi:MAG TPA: cellulase-like family protein [Arachnia sp.]|nr:cellulase-like family protein [Arachnia sp.]